MATTTMVATMVCALISVTLAHPYRGSSNPFPVTKPKPPATAQASAVFPSYKPSLASGPESFPASGGFPASRPGFPGLRPQSGPDGWHHGASAHRPGYTPVKGSSWRPQFGPGIRPATPPSRSTTEMPSNKIDFDEPSSDNANGQPSRNSVSAVSECQDGGRTYSVGEKWTPEGGCGRRSCGQGGKTTSLGCPAVESSPNCTVTPSDPRQPWPSCCPTLICVQ